MICFSQSYLCYDCVTSSDLLQAYGRRHNDSSSRRSSSIYSLNVYVNRPCHILNKVLLLEIDLSGTRLCLSADVRELSIFNYVT
jgi:hypothetical protein